MLLLQWQNSRDLLMALQIEEQRNLIAKFVKSNIKFQGNEDLFEDFCNEAYQKSYIIFNSAAPIRKIESYVQKVVNTSIIGVLKDSGRLKRTTNGFVKVKEIPFIDEPIKPQQEIHLSHYEQPKQPIQQSVELEKYQKKEQPQSINAQSQQKVKQAEIKPTVFQESKPTVQKVVEQVKEFPTSPSKEKITSEYVIDIEDPRENIEEEIIKKDLLQRIADAVCVIHSDKPSKLYLQIYEARYIRGLKQKNIASILGISQSEVSKRLIELSELIKNKIVG